jgi:glyoxylase I family protein
MSMQIFSHVAITCNDPIATEKFYTQYFGFKRARVTKLPNGEQIVFIKMGDSAFYLEIFKSEQESPVSSASKDGYLYPSVRHIAFKVDNVDSKLAEIGEDAKITLGPLNFDEYIPELLKAGIPSDWWCIDLCFWPDAWDVTADSMKFLGAIKKKYASLGA